MQDLEGLSVEQAANKNMMILVVETERTPHAHIKVSGKSGGKCYLLFWSRVVDELTAAKLPKNICLPLDDGEEFESPLYLDGSWFMNPMKSVNCIAWLFLEIRYCFLCCLDNFVHPAVVRWNDCVES